MPVPVDAPMPPDLVLGDGYIVRFAAVDPVTGANVSGVVVSAVSVLGTPLTDVAAGVTGPYELIPGPQEAV